MSDNQFDVLERAGFWSDGANGVLLSGNALLLRDRWVAFLTAFLRRFSVASFTAPLFIAEETLVRAGYLDHFPQNVFTASSYQGAGPAQFIAPAACLHLYPRLSRYDYDEGPFVGFVQAHCARYEGGKWQFPFRMSEFHMAELVIVGGVALVERIYRQVQEELVSELQRLRLPGELKVATDAFFLGSDDGARIMQKLKELKKEYVVNCAGQDVALASLNKHESYFATRFELKAADGSEVNSFCLAFGIERLVAASILLWGNDARFWPEGFRPEWLRPSGR